MDGRNLPYLREWRPQVAFAMMTNVVIVFPEQAHNVEIAGSWDRCVAKSSLKYDPSIAAFFTCLQLRCGTHQFKFFKDREWCISRALPAGKDNTDTFLNNVVKIPDSCKSQSHLLLVGFPGAVEIAELHGSYNRWGAPTRMDRVSADSFGVAESAIELKFTIDSVWCTNPHIPTCRTGVYENNFVRVPSMESQASNKKTSPKKLRRKNRNRPSRFSTIFGIAVVATLLALSCFSLLAGLSEKSESQCLIQAGGRHFVRFSSNVPALSGKVAMVSNVATGTGFFIYMRELFWYVSLLAWHVPPGMTAAALHLGVMHLKIPENIATGLRVSLIIAAALRHGWRTDARRLPTRLTSVKPPSSPQPASSANPPVNSAASADPYVEFAKTLFRGPVGIIGSRRQQRTVGITLLDKDLFSFLKDAHAMCTKGEALLLQICFGKAENDTDTVFKEFIDLSKKATEIGSIEGLCLMGRWLLTMSSALKCATKGAQGEEDVLKAARFNLQRAIRILLHSFEFPGRFAKASFVDHHCPESIMEYKECTLELYKKAANLGSVGVLNVIGVPYATGYGGLPFGFDKAAGSYVRGILSGYVDDISNLSMHYEPGMSGPAEARGDISKAVQYYKACMRMRNKTCTYVLARWYEEGILRLNIRLAESLYRRTLLLRKAQNDTATASYVIKEVAAPRMSALKMADRGTEEETYYEGPLESLKAQAE